MLIVGSVRNRSFVLSGIALLLGAAVSLGVSRLEETPPPENLLPADAVVLCQWDGFTAHEAAWRQTAAYEALVESGCADFAKKLAEGLLAQAPPDVATLLEDAVGSVISKGVSFAIALNGGQGPPTPFAVLVLHRSSRLAAELQRLVRQAAGPRVEWQEKKINGRQVVWAALPRTPNVEAGWWSEGEHLVIAIGIQAIERATSVAAGTTPNVTHTQLWKTYHARKRAGVERTWFGWFDFRRLREAVQDIPVPARRGDGQPIRVGQIIEAFGLDRVGTIVSWSGLEGRAIRSETFVEAPAPRTGLLALADQKPMTLKDLPPLPAGSPSFAACRFDASRAYDEVLRSVRRFLELAPADAQREAEALIASLSDKLGFDPKADLCDSLGDVFCLYADPNQGGLFPGFGLVVKVDDSERLRSTVDLLLRRLQDVAGRDVTIQRTTKGGRELIGFTFRQGVPLGAFAIGRRWACVALSTQSVESFFLRVDGKLDSWRPSAEYEEVLNAVPKQFTQIALGDPRPGYRTLLGAAPLLFSIAQAALDRVGRRTIGPIELPVTAADIPPAELFVRPLFPNVAVWTVEEDGFRGIARYSLPGAPIFGQIGAGSTAATTGVLVALLLPAVQQAREAARRTRSRNNLKQLGLALHNYHDAYGRFPVGTHPNPKLPPEKRLSWMADVLPFVEQAPLYEQIDFEKPWDDPANRRALSRQVSVFVNPGQRAGRGRHGVTHYVGLAGLGRDAPMLPVTSRRAGVFGYDRIVRIRDIRDGSSNTMAVSEANKKLGPWGAGGPSTIRALTTRPCINGPDGIGGPFRGGVSVLFVDGSVRFVSES
ncbi:MAG: DUF1559 domain-containing protein, partial [Planctomycetes bacterium]|nr:DUF1559 domain-containing protein [Planctomycetota bacterium]